MVIRGMVYHCYTNITPRLGRGPRLGISGLAMLETKHDQTERMGTASYCVLNFRCKMLQDAARGEWLHKPLDQI